MFSRVYAISDHALTFECSGVISEEAHQQVMALQHLLEATPFEGFIESVPAYGSLTVYFNHPATALAVEELLTTHLASLAANAHNGTAEITAPNHIIPVCYDPEFAPDLQEVSKQTGLTESDIIAMHTGLLFRVYMIGFVPGFAYMGILPDALQTTRRQVPRQRVPAGSVALAGLQTGIYPADIPGGWNIVGKTPLRLFDKHKDPCCLLRAGDRVKFESISKKEFETYT